MLPSEGMRRWCAHANTLLHNRLAGLKTGSVCTKMKTTVEHVLQSSFRQQAMQFRKLPQAADTPLPPAKPKTFNEQAVPQGQSKQCINITQSSGDTPEASTRSALLIKVATSSRLRAVATKLRASNYSNQNAV